MCKMVFSVQGKTDNYVKLMKDGGGIEFLGIKFPPGSSSQKTILNYWML